MPVHSHQRRSKEMGPMHVDQRTTHEMIVGMGHLVFMSFFCLLQKLFALDLDFVKALNSIFLVIISMHRGSKKSCPCSLTMYSLPQVFFTSR